MLIMEINITIFFVKSYLVFVLLQGLLESLEIEIRANFIEEPLSIYTATMESSFGRLFVHAVSQYLGLDSMSKQCLHLFVTCIQNIPQVFITKHAINFILYFLLDYLMKICMLLLFLRMLIVMSTTVTI